MACYAPLIGIKKGVKADGTKIIKILPHGAIGSDGFKHDLEVYDIPCGHCIGCRTDQAHEWANRLLMESLYHESAYFITLTYCEEYLSYHIVPSQDLETGEYMEKPTLCKSDWQGFMKRLREKFPDRRLRFYACGEYGDQTDRPHMHAIIFGLPKPEEMKLKYAGVSETGSLYFRCPVIEECWIATGKPYRKGLNSKAAERGDDPSLIGNCQCEPANYYTFKYVAGYVTKKIGARPNQIYELENRVPPFSLSSRKPGIGYQYLIDNPDCMNDNKIVIGTPSGKVSFPPPRFFKKKFQIENPEVYEEMVKKNIKRSKERMEAELSKTDLLENEYLEVKEAAHLARQRQRNKI